jgi:hypothetical protein
MKKQFLVGATALVLAAGMTTGAMALDHSGGFHSERYEGVRGFSGWRDGEWGSHRSVGGYGHHYNYGGSGTETYCPAFSRCGAGLPGGQ